MGGGERRQGGGWKHKKKLISNSKQTIITDRLSFYLFVSQIEPQSLCCCFRFYSFLCEERKSLAHCADWNSLPINGDRDGASRPPPGGRLQHGSPIPAPLPRAPSPCILFVFLFFPPAERLKFSRPGICPTEFQSTNVSAGFTSINMDGDGGAGGHKRVGTSNTPSLQRHPL